MSELKERVREIAFDVVWQVNGEDIKKSEAGISFRLPIRINERVFAARFAWYPADLEFDSVGVYDNNDLGARALTEFKNHELVVEQVRRLNNLYDNRLRHDVLRRYGFRDREQLRQNL
jgi:hypothetical protein